MIVAILLAAALAAPVDKELPKHWDQYPDPVWKTLISSCIKAASDLGYPFDKTEAYCTCHLFFMIESTPFDEFDTLKKNNGLTPLFKRAHKACEHFGFGLGDPPAKKEQPKPEQKPKNPLKVRPGSSVA